VPFLLFFPQPVASFAGLAMVVHQTWLIVSGNFSWLNVLTLALAFSAFDDARLGAVLPIEHGTFVAPPTWFSVVVIAFMVLVAVLSFWPARNLLSRRQLMNFSFNPLHLVNAYGAFGSVTRERYEVVLEGTDAPRVTPEAVWREYAFMGKPGDPQRRPPQVAPYHLRLDWLMWFAAMSTPMSHPWLLALVERLLLSDRQTLKLLRHDPFDGRRPTFVRASFYRYRFSTRDERRASGAWWVRTRIGDYLPPLSRGPGETESGPHA
jgi:Lipase maturation factor